MTRVVVPYVPGMLQPATVESLGDLPGVRYSEIDPDDDAGYSRVLIALWEAGESFVIVEQDVAPPPGWFYEMDACPNRWCTRPPAGRIGLDWLGCARFSAPLLAEHPTIMADAMALTDDGDTPGTWRKADVRLARTLRVEHVAPCQHMPPVEHHHPVTPGRQPW